MLAIRRCILQGHINNYTPGCNLFTIGSQQHELSAESASQFQSIILWVSKFSNLSAFQQLPESLISSSYQSHWNIFSNFTWASIHIICSIQSQGRYDPKNISKVAEHWNTGLTRKAKVRLAGSLEIIQTHILHQPYWIKSLWRSDKVQKQKWNRIWTKLNHSIAQFQRCIWRLHQATQLFKLIGEKTF